MGQGVEWTLHVLLTLAWGVLRRADDEPPARKQQAKRYLGVRQAGEESDL